MPAPINSQDARTQQSERSRSNTANVQQVSVDTPFPNNLSPVESVAPSGRMDLAASNQTQSISV